MQRKVYIFSWKHYVIEKEFAKITIWAYGNLEHVDFFIENSTQNVSTSIACKAIFGLKA